ncbi:MAG: FAD-dependent oxidoreductase, partial [Catalinimonas sp.]
MSKAYDLIVVGAGAAGLYVAIASHKLGLKRVLIIDREEARFGGDCLNVGCVPSKALLHVARLVHAARAAEPFGLRVEGELDMRRAVAYLDERRDTIRRHEDPAYLLSLGIDVAIGEARFVSRNALEVDGQTYAAKKFVLAVGSVPRTLDVPGADRVKLYTNESVFDLEALPKRLLVVGGGPIGTEMSQAFRRLGAAVEVVDSGERILAKDPPETAHVLQEQLKTEGIVYHHETKVTAFTGLDTAEVERKDGTKQHLRFDAVLAAVGRELRFEALQLDRAEVAVEEGKIKVDEYLQTTNPRVFVCGDAVGQLQFTHAAGLHGRLLVNNFFYPGPLRRKVSYDRFSWVTYTDPEVATFGLMEPQLEKRGMKYEKLTYDFTEDDRAVIEGYPWAKMVLYT